MVSVWLGKVRGMLEPPSPLPFWPVPGFLRWLGRKSTVSALQRGHSMMAMCQGLTDGDNLPSDKQRQRASEAQAPPRSAQHPN